MKNRFFRILLAAAAVVLVAGPAHGQLFRAYLASDGSDANPCTLQLPCRLLPAALTAVGSGGEIWMLDSANYNTAEVSVTKSVTILAIPGVVGSVVVPLNGDAMTVTGAVDVTLRNLVFVPLPFANGHGVVQTGGTLTVLGSFFNGMEGAAIWTSGATAVAIVEGSAFRANQLGLQVDSGARGSIKRSTFVDNQSYAAWAYGNLAATVTRLDVSDSLVQGSLTGILASGTSSLASVAVSNCHVTGNTYGLASSTSGSGSTVLLASNNMVVHNSDTGIISFAGKVWASGNSVSQNGIGFKNEYNTVNAFESAGNNAVRNNTTNTIGTIVTVPTI